MGACVRGCHERYRPQALLQRIDAHSLRCGFQQLQRCSVLQHVTVGDVREQW